MKKIIFLFIGVVSVSTMLAQEGFDPEYVKVTNQRAQNIVDEMNIDNPDKELRVRDMIAGQYRALSKIHETRDEEVDKIRAKYPKEEYPDKYEKKAQKVRKKADKKVAKLHDSYLDDLSQELNEEQVEAVKDGMTYGVVPKTYQAFQEMLPDLTDEQKRFILENLKEAREKAMDAGSSHRKHWWFGKYKGKINNYLSQEGYDLKKAGEEWQKRIKEQEES